MKFSFQPDDAVCSVRIDVDVNEENGKIEKVHFIGGCPGSLKAVSKLVEGMSVEKAAGILRGITCGNKGTSCPDQLACALEKYLSEGRAEKQTGEEDDVSRRRTED